MSRHITREGIYFYVDNEDDSLIAGKEFTLNNKGYAVFGSPATLVHKFLMNCGNREIDHKDRDPLNNRRSSNLRIATRSQNQANRGLPKNNTTGYKGVSREISSGRFQATIGGYKKSIRIGRYDTAIDAAIAYDAMAIVLFGEFACTNASLGLLL